MTQQKDPNPVRNAPDNKNSSTRKALSSGVDVLEDAYVSASGKLISGLTGNQRPISGEERDKLWSAVTEEVKEHTMLLNKLNREGLERRGVVPTAIFKQLVGKLGLYTFRTLDKDGRVKADVKACLTEAGPAAFWILLLLFVLCCMIIVLSATSVWFPEMEDPFQIGAHSVGLAVARITAAAFFSDYGLKVMARICVAEFYLINRLSGLSFNRLLKEQLWALRDDTLIQEQSFNDSGNEEANAALNRQLRETTVRVELHPVPEPIQARVSQWQAAGYRPYLVVDEKAFRVVLDEKFKANMRRIRELRAPDADPLYCVDIGAFTVIIDQYGPFPSEQEVVAFVEDQYRLLRDARYGSSLS